MKLEEINNRTKDAVSYLVEALESGQSEVLTQYLSAMGRFHNYSFGNIMLIARQKPDATNVAGLRTWNSLGRFVKRGEKGIMILAPMIGHKKADSVAEATEDAKQSQVQLYGFRAVYVFDISQTEGKDLPTLTEVQGDVSGYRERLVKFVESRGIALDYSETIAPAKGLSHGGKITLLSGMQPAEEFSTLAHEIGHEMLHRGERRTLTTKQVRETEAEAVAFVVCQAIGLETGSAAADYIQLWHGDANLLRESLEAVQQTAAMILGGITPEVAEAARRLKYASRKSRRSALHSAVIARWARIVQVFLLKGMTRPNRLQGRYSHAQQEGIRDRKPQRIQGCRRAECGRAFGQGAACIQDRHDHERSRPETGRGRRFVWHPTARCVQDAARGVPAVFR